MRALQVGAKLMPCIRARRYRLRKTNCRIDQDLVELCQPRTFSPGERVFKPARTLYLPTTGLLALVRTAPSYPISPCAYF
jgi:hypothetical protein